LICQLGQWLIEFGERATAMVLFKQALAPDNWIAAKTAFWRGWLAHGEDNLAARAAYQEAIDSPHYEYAAKAATNLGVLLAEQGEEAEALNTFRLVRSLPRCTATPKAAFNTGVLLERAGRLEEARTAFEEAIDPYNPIRLPGAVARLAHLLLRTNEQDAAKALLEQWRNADDPELAAAVTDAFEELRSCPTSGDLMIEPIWSS
jgi:tetratricopeptide (TPR) repeat protein